MHKNILLLCLMVCLAAPVQSQHRREAPVLTSVSNQAVVQSVYPTATNVEKVNDFWYKIVDEKKKTLGYALNSTNFCQEVKGYRNTTPVLIITDKKFVIKKVALLSNYESQGYVSRLVSAGFFESWVGKKVTEAGKSRVDGSTGATYTANAVVKNVSFLLENGAKKLPK